MIRFGTKHLIIKTYFVHTSQEDEMQSIKNLIDSAVLDPDVKGGLRWPFGKATSGDRYSIVGVWHTMSTSYQNSSIKLKVRHADRFDFKTKYGEDSKEISLKLKGIVSGLLVSTFFPSSQVY